MTANGPTGMKPTIRVVLGTLAISLAMLITLLVPTSSAEASSYSGNPCPHYAVQNVFDDPTSDWDRDGVNNSDELYNGLNPCIVDTANFCGGGGNPLCVYRTYGHYVPSPCQRSITAYPTGDYDGDGISNADELRNYADPCRYPCPGPTNADLALNPNGDWDGDLHSNAIEVNQGTDPCSSYSYYVHTYNPCPYYSTYDVKAAPNADWDGDGITNANEVRYGHNPCAANVVYTPRVTQQTTQRLPHVTTAPPRTVYVAPKRTTAVCPQNYPYYHKGNGQCYANPVRPFGGY